MTLLDLVVAGGVVSSLALSGVLASLRPSHHRRRSLCLMTRPDEGCEERCLHSCPLLATHGGGLASGHPHPLGSRA
jgi:hypothetical protein